MSGYLESYGAGDRKRERALKGLLLSLSILAALGGTTWFLLRNYKEDARAAAFVELLKKKDYGAAYAMWGCTVDKPCRDYGPPRFLEDWGDKGAHADASAVTIEKTRNCNGGVIRKLRYPKDEAMIFVSRADLLISFPPWGDACKVRVQVPIQ